MGVYALLSGPIISLVILTMALIENGGFVEGADGIAGTAASLAAEIALIMIFPIILVVVVWKQISWAGKTTRSRGSRDHSNPGRRCSGRDCSNWWRRWRGGGWRCCGRWRRRCWRCCCCSAGGAAGASGAGAASSSAGASGRGVVGLDQPVEWGSVAQRGRKFATGQSQTLSKVDDSVVSPE